MQAQLSRKLKAIKSVADYGTLERAQIQELIGISSSRVARALLQTLVRDGLIMKTNSMTVRRTSGQPAKVYYSSRLGIELLAAELNDDRYLRVSTRTPLNTHLYHWVELAELHIRFDQAIEKNPIIRKLGWYSEWDEIEPAFECPEARIKLWQLLSEKPRIVCAPDAVFAVEFGEYSKSYFVELDRSTSGIAQICHSKSPGYATMAAKCAHRKFFTTSAELFSVLHFSPTPNRRDLLRKEMASRDGASLHRFVCFKDWTPDQALTAPIIYRCDSDEPQPLVRLSAAEVSA